MNSSLSISNIDNATILWFSITTPTSISSFAPLTALSTSSTSNYFTMIDNIGNIFYCDISNTYAPIQPQLHFSLSTYNRGIVNAICMNGSNVIIASNSGIYWSNNNGYTFTMSQLYDNIGNTTPINVAYELLSIQGQYLVAGSFTGGVLISYDNGEHWFDTYMVNGADVNGVTTLSLVPMIENGSITALSIACSNTNTSTTTGILYAGNVSIVPPYIPPTPPEPPIPPIPEHDICFGKGTLIYTDQGYIEIEKIICDYHSIKGEPIQCITETYPNNDHFCLCVKEDAIAPGVPNRETIITKEHIIYNPLDDKGYTAMWYYLNPLYIGKIVKIDMTDFRMHLLGNKFYNVLLNKHMSMMANNMLVETLDPNNIVAKLYMLKKYTNNNKTMNMNMNMNKLNLNIDAQLSLAKKQYEYKRKKCIELI